MHLAADPVARRLREHHPQLAEADAVLLPDVDVEGASLNRPAAAGVGAGAPERGTAVRGADR